MQPYGCSYPAAGKPFLANDPVTFTLTALPAPPIMPGPMKKSLLPLCFAVALAVGRAQSAAPAASAPPAPSASVASVERLLAVSHADALLDKIMDQIVPAMERMVAQMAEQKQLSPAATESLKQELAKGMAQMRQQLTWDQLKPIYVKVYCQTLSEQEVRDLTAFYATPSGQSVLAKLPIVMQQSMQLAQPLIIRSVQGVQAHLQEYADQLSANSGGAKG